MTYYLAMTAVTIMSLTVYKLISKQAQYGKNSMRGHERETNQHEAKSSAVNKQT